MTPTAQPGRTQLMETCDVLFLVKNGSGFGHMRRATLLSKALQRIGVTSVVFSQASSLALFDDPELRVVNFPLLERLKSSAADEAYTALMDAVATRLSPSLLVEDTYPDPRYRSLPSLRSLPRVLVLRRLDPVSFDHLRLQGEFSHYDHVLVAQIREDFRQEPHTAASRRLVESSGRFSFVGPVFHEPSPHLVAGVRGRYADRGQPLVVVNAGSGGDQLNDAYADRLFHAACRVARDCLIQGIGARFVLVLGPYYRGRLVRAAENVQVVGFEPQLAVLLRAASVAVIRPGHNVVHEALCGDARLVLVPGIPWMEGQREFAERLGQRVGASVVDVDDYTALRRAVIDAICGGRRCHTHVPVNGTAAAAEVLAGHAARSADGPAPRPPRCLLVVSPPRSLDEHSAADIVQRVLSVEVPVIEQADRRPSAGAQNPLVATRLSRLLRRGVTAERVTLGEVRGVFVDLEIPAGTRPDEIAGSGVAVLMYADQGDVALRARHWLSFNGERAVDLVDAPLDLIRADVSRLTHLGWSLAEASARATSRGLLLDCAALDENQFRSYLCSARDWLGKLSIRPVTLPEFSCERVAALHGAGGRADVRRPA